jgi:hypothetical protein
MGSVCGGGIWVRRLKEGTLISSDGGIYDCIYFNVNSLAGRGIREEVIGWLSG